MLVVVSSGVVTGEGHDPEYRRLPGVGHEEHGTHGGGRYSGEDLGSYGL